MATDTTTTITVPTCVDCGKDLLTQWVWIRTPRGDQCLGCEARELRARRWEELERRHDERLNRLHAEAGEHRRRRQLDNRRGLR